MVINTTVPRSLTQPRINEKFLRVHDSRNTDEESPSIRKKSTSKVWTSSDTTPLVPTLLKTLVLPDRSIEVKMPMQ